MAKTTGQDHAWGRLGAALLVFAILTGPVAKAASPPLETDVLTLSEAAQLLRVGANELEELASKDQVPARRIGSSWRFNRDALMAWLNGDWHLIAAIEGPDANRQASLNDVKPAPPMAGLALTPRELEPVRGAGTRVAQAQTGQTGSPPSNNGEMPIGEAPEQPTAEDVFLRGQKILLARGESAVDIGQFYSRSDIPQLAVVGNGIGLVNLKQSAFTTLLLGRVGIFDETELFVSSTFRDQSSDLFSGSVKINGSDRSEFGDVRLGVRRTLLQEGPGLPNIIATIDGHIPTGDTSYAVGGGLALVKSIDPVALFAVANYRHTFSREFSDITRLEPESRFDVTLGYALALNDTLTISTSVSGVFSGETRFATATLLRQDIYSLQLGLTSFLARGLYIEPTVSFGLSGPGNSVAFGVTLPYSF